MKLVTLIPVYNEEKYLRYSLSSLVEQEIKPDLVIIGDNESIDDSIPIARKILAEYGIDHSIIRVKRIRGWSKLNINNVLDKMAQYVESLNEMFDYLSILEADVFLEKKYFGKLIGALRADTRLCITGGRLEPLGIPLESFPLSRGRTHLWGCNRLYRYNCWRKLVSTVSIRYLPTWDTDHVIMALILGYRVYPVESALSYALRPVNPFKGEGKGIADYLHGLPLWWAIYKTVVNTDLMYLAGYLKAWVYREDMVPSSNTMYSLLTQIYRYGAMNILKKKIMKIRK